MRQLYTTSVQVGQTHREKIDMPLAYLFYLSRQEQNDHFRFGKLYVFPPKIQIILNTIY